MIPNKAAASKAPSAVYLTGFFLRGNVLSEVSMTSLWKSVRVSISFFFFFLGLVLKGNSWDLNSSFIEYLFLSPFLMSPFQPTSKMFFLISPQRVL